MARKTSKTSAMVKEKKVEPILIQGVDNIAAALGLNCRSTPYETFEMYRKRYGMPVSKLGRPWVAEKSELLEWWKDIRKGDPKLVKKWTCPGDVKLKDKN